MPAAHDDELRRQRATSLLDGTADAQVARDLRRRVTRLSLLLVLALVVLGVVVLAVAVRAHGDEVPAADVASVPDWRSVCGLVVQTLGLLLAVVGFGASRKQAKRAGPVNLLLLLTRQQRRQLRREVRGHSPVSQGHAPLLVHTATVLAGSRRNLLCSTGIMLGPVGRWVEQPTRLLTVLVLLEGVALAVAWPLGVRDARRAEAFLARSGAGRTTA